MFDLEKSIDIWKKTLRRSSAFEESHIVELEGCLRDEIADLIESGANPEDAYQQAVVSMGQVAEASVEFYKAHTSGRSGRPPWRPPMLIPALAWNYFQVAMRRIKRHKGHSAINIISLAVGLACCILMMLWVREELDFDRFHENRSEIFRLITETKTENAITLDSRSPTPLGPALEAEIPDVLDYCRYQGIEGYGIKHGDETFFDDIVATSDASFFDIFTFPFVQGDPKTALVNPRSIVITEGMARKFFGDEVPMGQVLQLPNGRDDYLVTGIIRDVPEQSHLHFDCVIPIDNMREYHHVDYGDWTEMFFYTYVRLAPQASSSTSGPNFSRLIGDKTGNPNISLRLQPLKDVHLHSNFQWDLDNYRQGNGTTLAIFAVAASAILFLACINFMNLSTARSSNRIREVGLRKVSGASRCDIVKQFLGESVILSFISLAMSLILVHTLLPLFNSLAGKQLELANLLDLRLLPALLGITLLTGILAGGYPAFFLAAFQPGNVIKGVFPGGARGQAGLRKGLVIVQFTLTVFLVIGTLIVDKQLRYIQEKDLGIDTHNVINVELRARYESMRNAFFVNPNILSMTQSWPPGRETRGTTKISWEGKNPEDKIMFYPIPVDAEYLKTFRLEISEGRFFSEDFSSDRTEAVVLNQTAARIMGPESPVGKRLTLDVQTHTGPFEQRTFTVIGVLRDFHQGSLHRAIEPMFFTMDGHLWPFISVRISPIDIDGTIAFLSESWKSLVPNYPFTYDFIDDGIVGFYQSEGKMKTILGIFTVLALFTACLGLFGLASYMAERMTKEIGIRKVLGASVTELALKQIRQYVVWILVANAMAWPVVAYAVERWLQGFAYHTRPGIEPALLAAVFSLGIAVLTVGYKAFRAARANPAESLRYEE